MTLSYYDRSNVVHIDGTRIFRTQQDSESEHEVARLIESAWNCELREFGALSPVDWYAVRMGRLIGLLELKARSHNVTTYPTIFLNVRKWLALSLGSVGMGVPAIFVVKFQDGIRWIPIRAIQATQFTIAGCSRLVKSKNDIEPVIEVAMQQLKPLRSAQS